MKTTTLPPPAAQWLLIDAEGQNLGRLAAKVAHILRGKHRRSFAPHQLCGDHIVVLNAAKLAFQPRKFLRKSYADHTGYLGHFRRRSLADVMRERPAEVIERAVHGMLPKNRLRARMLKRLHVFAGSEHSHAAQNPVPLFLS
jgi:large subunit ribosomal protein L13